MAGSNPLPWREILMVAAAVVVVVWIANFDPFGSKQRLQNRAVSGEQQAAVSGATTTAVERVTERTIILHDKSERARQNVQAAPGAETPLSADLLSAWAGGVRDLRSEPPGDDPG